MGKKSHSQNEAKCKTFFCANEFFAREEKNIFIFRLQKKKHISGFAVSLALKRGLKTLGNGLLAQATVTTP